MHRLVFFGLDGAFSAIPLRALARAGLAPVLVVRGLERGPGRPRTRAVPSQPTLLDRIGQRLRFEPAEPDGGALVHAAREIGLDVMETDRVVDALSTLRRIRAHAFVVAGFSHLLPPPVLAAAERGGLNLHPGRLPTERGPAPLFWALRAGRTELHWTLHVLDRGEDTGDVVTAGSVTVEPGTAGLDILARMAQDATPSLVRGVRALLAGDLVRHPQSGAPGRCPRPRFADGCIDPGRPAKAVYTFVGGCADRYSLYAEVAGDRFFVRRAVSYDPGADMDYDFVLFGDRLLLRCQPGVVELELKPDGALFSASH